MAGPVNKLVKKARYPLILTSIAWAIFAVQNLRNLSPLTQQEIFMPDDHFSAISQGHLSTAFAEGVYTLFVDI